MYLMRGFGDGTQAIQQTGAIATRVVQAAAGGAVAGATGVSLAVAVPLIGAALAGLTLLAIELAKGCGETCIVASDYANKVEDILRQNLAAYMASPHTRTAQAVALSNFDQLWNAAVQFWGQSQLGDAGKRGISDRQAGACTWKANGACWNWFSGYRDPIANDPHVVEDTAVSTVTAALESQVSLPGIGGVPAWALVAAAGLGLWAFSNSSS